MLKKIFIVVFVSLVLAVVSQTFCEAQTAEESLVLYLPFDEGSGGTAEDHSELFQNDGTLEGGDWVNGKLNKALSFDGSSYVGVMPGGEVSIGQGTTWAFWFKTDVEGQTAYLAVLHGTMMLHLSSGSINAEVWTNPGGALWNPVNSGVAPKSGEWYHVAATWSQDSGEITIYINGEEQASAPAAGATSFKGGRQLAIAGNDQLSYPGDGLLSGVIDDFRIYNRALSEAEIMEIILALAVSHKGKLVATWREMKK